MLELTKKEKRILITFDTDFQIIPLTEFPGVLLIRIYPNTDRYVLPAIQKLLNEINQLEFHNRIIILERNRIEYFK